MRILYREIVRRERLEQRAADQRAGLLAATIVNMSGKVSKRTARPEDFFRYRDDDDVVHDHDDTPEGLRSALLEWARNTPGVKVS